MSEAIALPRQRLAPAWRAMLPWLVAALVAAGLPFVLPGGFALSLLCRMAIAIVFALSFNMLLGQGGMLDFGHAVFLGFGGFAALQAMKLAGAGWWLPTPMLPLVGAAGGLAAALLAGWVATRRSGTAFAMITLGIAELGVALVLLFPGTFGGEEGLSGDRSAGPALLGFDFGTQMQAYAVIAGWAWAAALLMWCFTRTPLGRLANAVRDNAERVSFLGYDPARIRLLVFAAGGLFAGVAGGLVAINDEIATSANMSPDASGAVLLMTFIGGIGIFWGPVVGAVLITLLSVALGTVTEAWQLYSGLLFVAMVVWAPGGIAGFVVAHGAVIRGGRLPWLAGAYAAVAPGLAMALAGVVGLAEMAFRLQAVRNGASLRAVLGYAADPGSAGPWVVAGVLLACGAAWVRWTAPHARAAWQAAAQ